MDNKKEEKEPKYLNRREFFKCCAKAALPIIGGILLSKTDAVANALESADCNYGCSYSCRASCQATCQGACMHSCSSACMGTCQGQCTHSCSDSCQNTSKADLVKTDTICQKRDTIQKKPSK